MIPPPTPDAWEWTPQEFDILDRGAFFDWFLVRCEGSPAELFAADASVVEVDHAGKWWLYRRSADSAAH